LTISLIASSAFVQVDGIIERLNIAIVLWPENAIMILMSTLTFPILVIAVCRKSWKQTSLVNREKILEEIFELAVQKRHELKDGRKKRIFKREVFLLFR